MLLLRSTKGDHGESRIDVHFATVSVMLLRPNYDGIIIRTPSEEECARFAEIAGVGPQGATVLHVIEGEKPSFVLSASMQWHEDDGGVDDPSWFGHMVGTR